MSDRELKQAFSEIARAVGKINELLKDLGQEILDRKEMHYSGRITDALGRNECDDFMEDSALVSKRETSPLDDLNLY